MVWHYCSVVSTFFFFNDPAPTEIYPLSLHDALPISLLFTHPVNRSDLPFTALTGLVACDTFFDTPLHFPAYWHDADFNGVLPKGTPVVQCLPAIGTAPV